MRRYFRHPTKGVAWILSNNMGYVVKGRLGNKTVTYKPGDIQGEPNTFIKLILEHRGFIGDPLWQCTIHRDHCLVARREQHCIIPSLQNPSGNCALYPKESYPDLPHHLTVFRQIEG